MKKMLGLSAALITFAMGAPAVAQEPPGQDDPARCRGCEASILTRLTQIAQNTSSATADSAALRQEVQTLRTAVAALTTAVTQQKRAAVFVANIPRDHGIYGPSLGPTKPSEASPAASMFCSSIGYGGGMVMRSSGSSVSGQVHDVLCF